MRIRIDLGDSPNVPAKLDRAARATLRNSAEETARAIGRASESNQIAARTRVTQMAGSQATIVIGEGVPFARIRDRGGTIVPKRARVLRFESGEFRPRARQEGIGYIAKGTAEFGRIVNGEYHGQFSVLR